jgi:MoaA/NifB/PqqE/SkfB family radical SAM enzyme
LTSPGHPLRPSRANHEVSTLQAAPSEKSPKRESFKLCCLLVTYRCNAACAHCCVESDPHRRERMSLEEIRHYIDQAAEVPSIKMIVFSGGEPTLLQDDLVAAISFAKTKGLWTRIVSNGFWARTPMNAGKTLDGLIRAGLSEINFSLSDYHQPFVPVSCVRNGIEAAHERGLRALVAMPFDRRSKINPDTVHIHLGLERDQIGTIDELYSGAPYGTKRVWISASGVMPVTRAAREIPASALNPEEDFQEMRTKGSRCPFVLEDLTVRPDGDVQVCCGCGATGSSEFVLGNLQEESLKEIIRRGEMDLIFNWIAKKGPYDLAHFLQERDPSIPFRKAYVNICDMCVELMTRSDTVEALAKHAPQMAGELALTKLVSRVAADR